MVITRTTLVKISATSIAIVLDALLSFLEDVARPYTAAIAHPPHVLLSELYILELIADCCSRHWELSSFGGAQDAIDGEPIFSQKRTRTTPEALDEALVIRAFDVLKLLFDPIPEGYVLPAKTILDECSSKNIAIQPLEEPSGTPLSSKSDTPVESTRLLQTHGVAIESRVKSIVEYLTASSWPAAFDYFKTIIYNVRTTVPAQGAPIPNAAAAEDERSALVILRLSSFFWVDSQKLNLVVQEFCSSFLHFRKSFQNSVAIVAPLLVTRWLDRYPDEFVQLHMIQKRRDAGPDTLFDMTQTIVDNGRRRTLLYPLQTTLLLLLPDVFEVASNLREAKSGGMAKKVAFLESLRKALRNRNEQAAYCLVSILRAARHFDAENDSALVSYAMDVQDEVRDAVFRRPTPGLEGGLFDQDVMTAAFVSLAHLNFEDTVSSLAQSCLVPSAPPGFKIAVIQACSHFARLSDSHNYQGLFTAASAFLQGQLKV